LSKGITYGGTPRQQPPGYIPLLSYPVCLQAGRTARADAGFAVLTGLDIVTVACAALPIALCLRVCKHGEGLCIGSCHVLVGWVQAESMP
jgi:hypothetical protein